MAATGQKKLTRFIKRLLGAAWFLFVGLAIIMPIVAIAAGSDLFFEADGRFVELFLGFKILPELASGAARDLIHGHSKVQLNTPSSFAWFLSMAITELSLFVFLYGLAQLRAIFAALVNDGSFTPEIAGRIKKVGIVLLGWQLMMPLLQFFGGRAILNETAIDIPGLQLYPAFEVNLAGIFIGLAVIVLSGVLSEAAHIQEEQSLTI
jgi:hypothetical protein